MKFKPVFYVTFNGIKLDTYLSVLNALNLRNMQEVDENTYYMVAQKNSETRLNQPILRDITNQKPDQNLSNFSFN
jgi:hypothetical protein